MPYAHASSSSIFVAGFLVGTLRLDDALKVLDVYQTEVRHYTWEDCLDALGKAVGRALYKEGEKGGTVNGIYPEPHSFFSAKGRCIRCTSDTGFLPVLCRGPVVGQLS